MSFTTRLRCAAFTRQANVRSIPTRSLRIFAPVFEEQTAGSLSSSVEDQPTPEDSSVKGQSSQKDDKQGQREAGKQEQYGSMSADEPYKQEGEEGGEHKYGSGPRGKTAGEKENE
jgi:hypothetical protein